MIILAFLIGLALPTLNGWLILRLLEWKSPVLQRTERWVIGGVLGLALTMLLTFVIHIGTGVGLHLVTFLLIQVGCLTLLGAAWYINRPHLSQPRILAAPSPSLSIWWKCLFVLLLGWTFIKLIFVGSIFTLMPTYLDDALDNWNLRAKVFYVDQTLNLVIPNEDPATSPLGVSSYPPAIPFLKVWFATLNGEWNDPLVNSIHVVWYIAGLILLYCFLRRVTSKAWAMLGVYLLGSIPLYFMHGTNNYGDAAASVHIFIPVALLWFATHTHDFAKRFSLIKIVAVSAALLPFIKNEGLVIYLPPILLLTAVAFWNWSSRGELSKKQFLHSALVFIAAFILCTLPWLLFKWSNGLTFGNAKSLTGLGISWHEGVLQSIFINTFFEGNWLLLFPLFFALLAWKWRTSLSTYWVLSGFFLIVYVGQVLVFLFTSLATEALLQTGYARGLIHLMPLVVFLTILLLRHVLSPIVTSSNALADEANLQDE